MIKYIHAITRLIMVSVIIVAVSVVSSTSYYPGTPAVESDPSPTRLAEVMGTTNSPGQGLSETPAASPTFELHPLESQLLSLLNMERLQRGLGELEIEPRLTILARERSADMASRNYFGHVNPEGNMVFSSLDRLGIGYRLAGENLARNNYPAEQSPDVAHQGFMNSPTHAENELEPTFSKVGVGVALTDGGQIYFTELFADMD